MRISELFEQTISSIGSTKAQPGGVPQVSQTPSPSASSNQQNLNQQTADPKVQQLAALLKQNRVVDNDADINKFLGAAQASFSKKALNPDQQEIMGKLAGPMMSDPKLIDKIKLLMPVKPGQQNQPTTQPGAPV